MCCYFYFAFLPLGPSCGECNVLSKFFCVALLMDLYALSVVYL